MNRFKLYRWLVGGIWYKIKYQMPYGKVYFDGTFLDRKMTTVIEWDTCDAKRGHGSFEILKIENYGK